MDAREQIDAAITKWRARTHHKNLEANVSAEQVDAVSKFSLYPAPWGDWVIHLLFINAIKIVILYI